MSYPKPIHEAPWSMWVPMILLCIPCLVIGIWSGELLKYLQPLLSQVTKLAPPVVLSGLSRASGILSTIGIIFVILILAVLVVFSVHCLLRRRRQVAETVTWDCGYAKPSVRMQYSATSFSQPITELFGMVLQTRKEIDPPHGYFPDRGSVKTRTDDAWNETLYKPFFNWLQSSLGRLIMFQEGRTHLYLLYIMLTLFFLIAWWGVT